MLDSICLSLEQGDVAGGFFCQRMGDSLVDLPAKLQERQLPRHPRLEDRELHCRLPRAHGRRDPCTARNPAIVGDVHGEWLNEPRKELRRLGRDGPGDCVGQRKRILPQRRQHPRLATQAFERRAEV